MKDIRNYMGGFGNRLFQFAFLYSQVREGSLPDIYLQNYKLFNKYRSEFRAMFEEGIIPSNYVSLHVRRGDYVNNPFYVDLTQTDYYDKAIAEFPNEKFLVFCADRQDGSDDLLDQDWVMSLLTTKYGDRFKLFKGFNELEDFNAMAGCKGHIMANSSFSFWASYIGEGKTVAPAR